MYCTNCGKQMADDAQFCPSCGHRPDQPAQQPQPPGGAAPTEPMPPPQPMAQAPPTAPVSTVPPPTSPMTPPPAAPAPAGGGLNWWLVGCAALVLLVLLAVGGFFGVRWWMARDAQPPAPGPVQTETEPEEPEQARVLREGEPEQEPEEEPQQEPVGVPEDDPEVLQEIYDVLLGYFVAWAEGDLEKLKAVCAPPHGDLTEERVAGGYERYYTVVDRVEREYSDSWRGYVVDVSAANDGGVYTCYFNMRAVRQPDDGRILVQGGRNYYELWDKSGEEEDTYYVALMMVHLFFYEWTKGDPDEVRERMTPELAEQTGDDPFSDSYEQVGLKVEDYDQVSDTQWDFTMLETFKNDDDTELQARYHLSVTEIEEGWRVSEWEDLD